MRIGVEFQGWRPFHADKDTAEVRQWLKAVGDAGVKNFRSGMSSGRGRASRPGAWPHSQSGTLSSTIKSTVTDNSVTISTSTHYSLFLRHGTSKMARRKMSDSAIESGLKSAGRKFGHWAGWKPGAP